MTQNIKWAVIDSGGNFCRGIITDGKHPGEVGEEYPEDSIVFQVERFPLSCESWNAELQDWVADEEKKAQAEAEYKLATCSRGELHGMIMQEVQSLVQTALQQAGLQLSAEQQAELFPLLGEES